MIRGNMYAPIVVFAFNRLEPLKACIASLLLNKEAAESDLIVFVDGPRANKKDEAAKVDAVRKFASNITGFQKVHTYFSDENKGLAPSIIGGVTEVINRYGKVIVIEDDLYLAPSFLSFMNLMLDTYCDDKRIMQVTGYSPKITYHMTSNVDYYLSGRAHSWSWGTWRDRWESVDWDVKDYDKLSSNKALQKAFNKYGSDLYGMLKGWHDGKNNSWYIRFNYSMHKQGKYCIAPIKSLVRNDGFGPEATHTSVYNRYKIDFNGEKMKLWRIAETLNFDERLAKHAVRFWNITYRIYGKVMTTLYKLFQ